MISSRTRRAMIVLTSGMLGVPALAQPKLIITGMGADLAATGQGVAGFGYDGAIQEYVPFTWARGAGFTRIEGAFVGGSLGTVACSSDLGALAITTDNLDNWGDLNCFAGYDTATGDPLPPYAAPCPIPVIGHRWTMTSGWVNIGSHPRYPDPGTGRLVGGTRCDFTINEARAISDDGRFVVANGWVAEAFRPSGSIGSGFCGGFLPYVYDSLTGTGVTLAVPAGVRTARADRINSDGSVLTGYILDPVSGYIRQTCVWRSGVPTILDPYLGATDSAGVNGPGNVLATGLTSERVAELFPGQSGVRLVRWTWNGGQWEAEDLGVPAAFESLPFSRLSVTGISDDGDTIVGVAEYGPPPPSLGGLRRPFIWRPTINGGVPMDLEGYVATIDNPLDPIFGNGFSMTAVTGMSADGTALLVTMIDARNTCSFAQSHITSQTGVLYLDGAQAPCEPPAIGLHPSDWEERNDYSFGSAFNVLASGSWPLTFQWQREDTEVPGQWHDLQDSCRDFDNSNWDYEGVLTRQLRVGQHFAGAGRSGRYRVVVSNSCGSVTSEPATLTHIIGACCLPGDFCMIDYESSCTANEGVWRGAGTECGTGPCLCRPDINNDGVVNSNDISSFLTLWLADVMNGTTVADFDLSGLTNSNDISAFLTEWLAAVQQGGC